MISKDEVLEIINMVDPDELKQIQVIIRYIFDKTEKDISNVTINSPQNPVMYQLMYHMYNVSKQYYKNG